MELTTLKVEVINQSIYKSILSICLNLKFFQFTIIGLRKNGVTIDPHLNLIQMIIKFEDSDRVLEDDDVENLSILCSKFRNSLTYIIHILQLI